MNKKYKIGFTASCFDLLHSGHITMLQEAKSVCEYLIVGLQIDPSIDRPEKNKPIQTLMERQIQLNAVKYIDEVICYSTEYELLHLLSALPIDVRIIGEEYSGKKFTGYDFPINVYFNKRHHNWSTTRLRKLILDSSENI